MLTNNIQTAKTLINDILSIINKLETKDNKQHDLIVEQLSVIVEFAKTLDDFKIQQANEHMDDEQTQNNQIGQNDIKHQNIILTDNDIIFKNMLDESYANINKNSIIAFVCNNSCSYMYYDE